MSREDILFNRIFKIESSSLTPQDVKRICRDLINENEMSRRNDFFSSSRRQDFFSSLKNYMDNDPELVLFKKLANENFSKELDVVTKNKIGESVNLMNSTMDKHTDQLVKTEPVDVIVKHVSKNMEPRISSLENLTVFNTVLGITNLILIGAFAYNRR